MRFSGEIDGCIIMVLLYSAQWFLRKKRNLSFFSGKIVMKRVKL